MAIDAIDMSSRRRHVRHGAHRMLTRARGGMRERKAAEEKSATSLRAERDSPTGPRMEGESP